MSENPDQPNHPSHTFIPKKALTTTPTKWFVECSYCQTTNMGHEQEILAKASLFCKKSTEHHFQEFLTAEFDTLDHSKLNPTGQIEILNAVHDKTGCDCLLPAIAEIENQTHNPDNIKNALNPANDPNSENRTNHHKPTKPSTLLDRLKIGPNRQGSTFR